jgi:hypothetical protein
MTLTNTFAAKASVAFVAIAMALSMIAPAQAQTAEELQAQIDALMATIASLQGGATATASADAYVFTRALTIGSQGADVTALQNYLIGAGFSIPAGATGYFGAQTQAAVAAWQTANGVTPAAGYFGPVSQAKYNALMAAMPDDSDDDSSDDDSSDDDSSSDELSGEASLDEVTMDDGDDTDIEEGQEAAPVAELEVEFTDGDAKITRIDLAFVGSGDEQDPWDTFEEVSLWVDGDEVASMAADDEDEYLDEDDGSLRFSGLDIVAMEDEPVTITVGVTVQGSVDGTNNGEAWEVQADAIRFVDADDVTTTDDSTGDLGGDGVDFDINEEGGDDELAVKTSSEDPDATTLQLEDDSKSDWLTVFAFNLDTDDSTNDITVNEIPVSITPGGDSIGDIISDLKLVIDGEEYDDWSYTSGAAASTTVVVVTFDTDGDLVIEAGDEVTAELQVEFKQLAIEGSTIQGSVTSTNADAIDAEGADDLGTSQLSGAATGETHTLRTSGAILEAGDMSETKDANSDTTTTDDEGVFTIKFDVTAFESDLYINKTAASGTTMGTVGVNYLVTNGSGTTAGTTTPQASISATADTVGTQYRVAEGETETFTLTVTFDPGTSGFYGVQLYSLNFDPDQGDNPSVQQRALPASDYETDPLSI